MCCTKHCGFMRACTCCIIAPWHKEEKTERYMDSHTHTHTHSAFLLSWTKFINIRVSQLPEQGITVKIWTVTKEELNVTKSEWLSRLCICTLPCSGQSLVQGITFLIHPRAFNQNIPHSLFVPIWGLVSMSACWKSPASQGWPIFLDSAVSRSTCCFSTMV